MIPLFDRLGEQGLITRGPHPTDRRTTLAEITPTGRSLAEKATAAKAAAAKAPPTQPRAARKFFEKYQDRIIFGTDASPHTKETPQQLFGDELYEIYFRFLETEDEYFDYAPAPKPPQGRWQIYGIGLPETILKKVYFENAARLLGVTIV